MSEINPGCTKPGTNIEWCANCEDEVELEQHLGSQECPTCKAMITNCTYCMRFLGNECDSTVKCGPKAEE